MKYTYTFDYWEHEQVPENAPPESILVNLPRPLPYRPYNPAWGKYSESGKKASATRNLKRHAANKETFLQFVLPVVGPMMDAESCFETGKLFKLAEYLERGNHSLWCKGDACQWIPHGHANEQKAQEIGAVKLSAHEALQRLETSKD